MKLSVVIPAKNEADNLPGLLAEIAASLQEQAFEVIVIDDASEDNSWALLNELKQQYPWLRALRFARSCGQSTAIWHGGRAALGDYVVTIDGDGQNDPADIPALLATAEAAQGNSLLCVCGIRTRRNDSWGKLMMSRIANGVRRRLLNDDVVDTGCGLKLISRELFHMLPYFNHMHRYFPALSKRAGAQVLSQSVNHRARTAGTSKYGLNNRLWVGLVDIFGVRWLQKRAKIPTLTEELK
ncbi:glycosyltransferase family 2 protein [Gallaecimonas sp. GXIMD1310]|uniref:glycosyltransferase family 2 protein n=1 Tax=Gallaecimonas sp. GXIMD1310 TaxID=3131926 RepID=UPI0032569085